MDPYAVQTHTYHPPSSSQLEPQTQDPYLYNQHQFDPSQQQYDPSQQHYAYYTQILQQPNPVYPEQVSKPQPEEDDAPIHPPGVPVENDTNQTAKYQQAYAQPGYQTDPNYYHQQFHQPQQLSHPDAGTGHQVQPQWQPQPGQPGEYGPPPNVQGGGSGGRGGFRGGRGGGRGFSGGGSSFRGRGGGTRVKSEPKPQFLAWCELCRVECNTHEVLETHKKGKKHKKNMEIQEELQRLAAKTHETQIAPEVKLESQTAQQLDERDRNGSKRKKKDNRKSNNPEKKHKQNVPFVCELCDVRCESEPAFDNHLKGRRHMFNVERFQEQQTQTNVGHVALQALYPALEAALYPAIIQALAHNASTSYGFGAHTDQHALLQLLQPFIPQIGPAFLPYGPPTLGPPQGLTQEAGDNQVDPMNGPESKTEDDVKTENKTEDLVEPEFKPKDEDGLEPESKPKDEVESETEIKTGGEVEPEIKSEEVDRKVVEPTR